LDGNITIDNSMLTDPRGYMESVVRGLDIIGNADKMLRRDYVQSENNYLNLGVGGQAQVKDPTKKGEDNVADVLKFSDQGANQIGEAYTDKSKAPTLTQEGGLMSTIVSFIPGMKSMAVFHDIWTEREFDTHKTPDGTYKTGMTMASIIPAIMINYYALALQTIKNPVTTYQATFSTSVQQPVNSSSANAQPNQ
jgi:hypothetical protein